MASVLCPPMLIICGTVNFFDIVFRAESGADPKHVITQVKEILKSEYDMDEVPNVFSVDDKQAERYAII